MGLDIYFHRVKANEVISNNVREVAEHINEIAKNEFAKKADKLYNELSSAKNKSIKMEDNSIYYNAYQIFLNKLSKDKKFKKYPFMIEKYQSKVLTIKQVKELLEKEVNWYYKVDDAYFRKVNFIYAFFQNVLVNEECLVEQHDIENLINTCVNVLQHHKCDSDEGIKFAQQNLPTQSGFFFGSTDYDNWYWDDVKDCLSQMRKLKKSLKKGDKIHISFSW